ncbi:MAG TPA: type II toxin-antitoxin system VapC family toxin [Candidatus Elarobacter sp.]|nr:type II toxin-antitoxin system VapC family toxin [Candidatus Elarobacter sp.]
MDTNVLSDLTKPRPNSGLRRWLDERDEESLYLSVLTLGEIRQGIAMAREDRKRRAKLEQALADFRARFAGRVLDVDRIVAETWGEVNGRTRVQGTPVSTVDALIAATAIAHKLIIVTGNARDFEKTGAHILNPFD